MSPRIVTKNAVIFANPPLASAPANATAHLEGEEYSWSFYDTVESAATDWETLKAGFDSDTYAGLQAPVQLRERSMDEGVTWTPDRVEKPGEFTVYWKRGIEKFPVLE